MTAISKAWVVQTDAATDADSPVDQALMQGYRDDLVHLREWLGASFYAGAVQDHNHDGVNSALASGSFQLATPVSAMGTSVDFGGIPSTAKEIIVIFSKHSTNGASQVIIQLGDSGGIETTGYEAVSSIVDTGATSSTFSTGFGVYSTNSAAQRHGAVVLSLIEPSANKWVAHGEVGRYDTASNSLVTGSKSLSSSATTVRVTMVNGTDQHDGGVLNVGWR